MSTFTDTLCALVPCMLSLPSSLHHHRFTHYTICLCLLGLSVTFPAAKIREGVSDLFTELSCSLIDSSVPRLGPGAE